MKKLIITMLAVTVVGFLALSDVQAQESEFELSGHVNTVVGWQRTHGNTPLGLPGASTGILNDGLRAPGGPEVDQFGFFVDEAEIDVSKSFGENIRLRADIEVTPAGNKVGFVGGQVGLEQAYVSFNVPAGNGGEILVGRYNSGIGLDPIDRNELSLISFSTIHRNLLPHNLTGARFLYNINENWSFSIFAANDLQDAGVVTGTTSELPSGGFQIAWSNAEMGEGSWVTVTGAAGPEQRTKRNISFFGDLAAAMNVSEGFYIDIEGIYRQDNNAAGNGDNFQYIAGTLQLRYAFSDIWDGTLRYGFTWDLDGGNAGGSVVAPNPLAGVIGLGFEGQQHDIALATGYEITDGARFVLEGRYDLQKPSASGIGKAHVYGVAGGFYYDF